MPIRVSAWLLGVVSWHVGGFLIDRYNAAGLLAFLLLIAIVFRRATAAVVSPIRGLSREGVGRLLEFRGRRWPSYTAAGVGLVLAAFVIPIELRVTGAFTVLPAHTSDVRAEVEGIIAEIYVDEGDAVEKGRLLARLSDRDQIGQLAAVDGAIQEKRARLKLLRAGPRREEIALAHADVSTARTKKTSAEERFDEAIRLQAARRSSAERGGVWAVRDHERGRLARGCRAAKRTYQTRENVGIKRSQTVTRHSSRACCSE
jgi:multidrug efflux pump subunit AcrA (membrane-fusion protein)